MAFSRLGPRLLGQEDKLKFEIIVRGITTRVKCGYLVRYVKFMWTGQVLVIPAGNRDAKDERELRSQDSCMSCIA